ncbi:hypothetical protein [Frankia sp. CiP3]|uniref:hypothetical protein n=1 Tax=Frankia sp. CiP3 TaxID=2880971 RepID=UPI001EF4B7EC|nr:hypothetical protein [Frankia sp. CiP3]
MSARPAPSPGESNARSAHLAVPEASVRLVTVIVGVVVGLTFLFGLGYIATLGVPTSVAVLVAPAVGLLSRDALGRPDASPALGAVDRAVAPTETARHHDGSDARMQDLLHRARAEHVLHWQQHQRPISADTLRKCLHIGTGSTRSLVAQLRRHKRRTQPPAFTARRAVAAGECVGRRGQMVVATLR